jgi:dihydroflavonol-4-reductase
VRVLVTGGAGFVGRATVRALVEAGHTTRVLSRDVWPSGSLFDRLGVEVITGEAVDPATMNAALADMDALVQAAATYRYDRTSDAVLANNAPLARTILEAAGRAGTSKVVDVSSLVVFALGHSPVDEDTPLTAPGGQGWTDPYLRSKVESEMVGRELEALGLPRVTVHPGTVIGPEDTAMGPSSGYITTLLAGGLALDGRAPFVDVRDVARAIVLALDAPTGSRFVLTSGVARLRDVAATIDELTGRRPRRLFLDRGAIRAFASLNDLAGGRLSILARRGSIDWILDNAPEVDTTRASRDLGLAFRPLRETLADTIRWWAQHDLIERRLAGGIA